jgi:hypothetical protein
MCLSSTNSFLSHRLSGKNRIRHLLMQTEIGKIKTERLCLTIMQVSLGVGFSIFMMDVVRTGNLGDCLLQ